MSEEGEYSPPNDYELARMETSGAPSKVFVWFCGGLADIHWAGYFVYKGLTYCDGCGRLAPDVNGCRWLLREEWSRPQSSHSWRVGRGQLRTRLRRDAGSGCPINGFGAVRTLEWAAEKVLNPPHEPTERV